MTTNITLRYFDSCPNWRVALERIHEAVDLAALRDVHIDLQRVESAGEAEQLGFRGSPTVVIDGRDPFADEGDPVGLSCRVFATENGPQGSPSVAQLRETLRASETS